MDRAVIRKCSSAREGTVERRSRCDRSGIPGSVVADRGMCLCVVVGPADGVTRGDRDWVRRVRRVRQAGGAADD